MWTPRETLRNLLEIGLRRYFKNEKIQITECDSIAALGEGENYTSEIFRNNVRYTTGEGEDEKEIALIAKCSPKSRGVMNDIVQEMQLFEIEVIFYNKVMPAIYDILGTSVRIAPICYTTAEDNSAIIFEDLKLQGFQLASRQDGLDLDHYILVIDKLAYYHAGATVFTEQNLEYSKQFDKAIFRKIDFTHRWTKNGFRELSKVCSQWEGCEKYSERLSALQDKGVENILATVKPIEGRFNILIHGDIWVNNMLFNYHPDGKVKDVRFLDFQLIVYTSPMIDFLYLWVTSTTSELKRNHFDKIFNHYYNKFVATLNKLNYPSEKIPTKEDLMEDLRLKSFYGLTTSITVLPLALVESREDLTMDNFLDTNKENKFREYVYNRPYYRETMELLLPFLDSLGALDFC